MHPPIEHLLPDPTAAQPGPPAAGTGSSLGTDSSVNQAGESQQPMLSEEGPNEGQTEEEVTEQIQARLPGANWRERIGAAGTSLEQQRVSPIVELSMLLVRASAATLPHTFVGCTTCLHCCCLLSLVGSRAVAPAVALDNCMQVLLQSSACCW